MSDPATVSHFEWYVVKTLSNQEGKVKRYIEKFVEVENLGDYIGDVLVPTEVVTEIKGGKKTKKLTKFYPGYVFVQMRLQDDHKNTIQAPWHFVRNIEGVIGVIEQPLKKSEMDSILKQIEDSLGRETPKIEFEVGQKVNITNGVFLNMSGDIQEIDAQRGRLKVSVLIFDRPTPVELEYWQVERLEE